MSPTSPYERRIAGGSAATAYRPVAAPTRSRVLDWFLTACMAALSVSWFRRTGTGRFPRTARGSTPVYLWKRRSAPEPDTGAKRPISLPFGLAATVLAVGLGPAGVSGQSPSETADPGPSEGPELVAEAFLADVAAHRWLAAAGRVHSETLRLFQYRVFSVLDADSTGRFAQTSFGVADGPELRGQSAERLFAGLLQAINRDTPALIAILATNAYQPLGWVPESPDLAHAVLRVTPYTNGSAPTNTMLMTLRRDGDAETWRLFEADVLDALSTAITGLALSARNGTS